MEPQGGCSKHHVKVKRVRARVRAVAMGVGDVRSIVEPRRRVADAGPTSAGCLCL